MIFKLLTVLTLVTARYCSERGGCHCDCSWASSCSIWKDDGSCCFGCCCKIPSTPSTPSISPPTPLPTDPKSECYRKCDSMFPNPSPTPSSPSYKLYCPSSQDLMVAYGTATLSNQGWTIYNGGGVATKSSFELLQGGWVEYDVDVSRVNRGINVNVYTISPTIRGSSFTQSDYCDGARTDHTWCVEIDWLESNGNCGGATTYHTIKGPGEGCTAWGCRTHFEYNGRTKFRMRIEHSPDGKLVVIRDGQRITPNDIKPTPRSDDWCILAEAYRTKGALIYSSQWTGWVPTCKGSSDNGVLEGSVYTVSNLKIFGSVLQGPEPMRC